MNDLPNVFKVLQFYLFADDTSIYFDANELTMLQKVVNRELRKDRKWLEANRLALNISKTIYVIFHSNSTKNDEFICIKLCRKAITRVNCVKYLGVLVASTLSWKPHVTELTKKLSRNCAVFFKIRHFVNQSFQDKYTDSTPLFDQLINQSSSKNIFKKNLLKWFYELYS